MPALTIACLCSAAVYRDGLLSILEAGIEKIQVFEYPATTVITLAVRVDFSVEDFGRDMKLELQVKGPADGVLATASYPVRSDGPALGQEPELTYYWVLVQYIPLQVQRPGRHIVRISLDGALMRELPFAVTTIDRPE